MSKHHLHHEPSIDRSRSGFALIASLSIMAVLLVITFTLFSLSSVSTQTAALQAAQTEAEANARTALMVAIGRLQSELGPDQRVSANASIQDTAPETPEIDGVRQPHWLGAWDSWIAGDPSGAPVNDNYPSAASHHQTIGDQPDNSMRPEYDQKNRHFRSWLVSLLESDIDIANPQNTALSLNLNGQRNPGYDPSAPAAVQLVGEASLGGDLAAPTRSADYVSARLIPIQDDGATTARGRFGWWVGDESQKAAIIGNRYKESDPDDLAGKLFRQQAPASLGNSEIPGLENLATEEELFSIFSRENLALINGATDELTRQFHDVTTKSLGVLADVREGGLKRDLSTLLEREIDPEEVYNLSGAADFERASSLTAEGESFMLYNFDDMLNSSVGNTGEAAVPIQDLAAYYQLYNRYRPDSVGGIQYSSSESSPSNSLLSNGIMVSNPDYGETQTDLDKYLRQHSALYRMPVPVKIEMMLSYVAEPIIPFPSDPNADRYNLRIGVSPAVTLWNPNNVPLAMNIGNPDRASYMMRETPMPLSINFRKLDGPGGNVIEENTVQFNKITNTQQGELYTFFISGNYSTVFEPGESKVFALRYASGTDADSAGNYVDFMLRGRGNRRFSETFIDELELVPGWNPERFIRPESDTGGSGRGNEVIFSFKEGDYFTATISNGTYNSFTIDATQKSRHGRNAPGVKWHFRAYQFRSRMDADATFRNDIVFQGFPGGGSNIADTTPRTIELSERSAQTLINAMGNPRNPRDDLPQPFFYYGIKAGTETHESNNLAGASAGAARRFVTRPFTHSTAMRPAWIDNTDPESFYNYGWNWFFMPLENIFDAPVEISGSNSGYYGGGYTAENGVTNIVQQQLPLTPPLSIASLSHAHLSGYSLGTEAAAAGYSGLGSRTSERYSRTTAIGYGGLAPYSLQAIGNSYAHPNIPAGNAFTTWDRRFEQRLSAVEEPFADHSYLANKALWDDFFFSSISPKPGASRAFRQDKTANEVASEFFFDAQALPNPRITPYRNGLDQTELDALLTEYDDFEDGFADKIAAHLMVDGPFNINSTSFVAWKALFSSLKGQEVSYLDAESALVVGTNLDFQRIDGVPLTGGPLPTGQAFEGSSSDPSDSEQWTGFRELTEDEIEELAIAMVEQVKKRGPFLSLSEFINRRLDPRNTDDMALKGALQAAIDHPDVSINSGFIDNSLREFSSDEKSYMSGAAFDDALEGPIAYGSSAYIDQADLLKNFPAQLTPRGDTFVVRAYGDTLDNQGNVKARAWCEAVVQRIPDYVDPSSDEPHVKTAELASDNNRAFGRQFKIIDFRWLGPSEI